MQLFEKARKYILAKLASKHDIQTLRTRANRPIINRDDLICFAKRVTHNWYQNGYHKSFQDFNLNDHPMEEPRRSMTKTEFNWLTEIQKEERLKQQTA